MSKAIEDYAAAVNAQFDAISTSVDEIVASQTGIAGDVAFLKDTIDKLQNSPGPISPDDQTLLNAAQERVNGLATKAAAASEALKALDAATETPPAP